MSAEPGSLPVALWEVGRTPPYAYPPSQRCQEAGATPTSWPSSSLAEALVTRYDVDTWFQAVSCRRARWARLAKPVLLEPWRIKEASAVLAYVVVDLDRPDHRTNPWRSWAEANQAVQETAALLDGAAVVYATRGGLRALWALAEPVPLPLAQSFLDQFHATLPRDLPVSVDSGVRDWTRGFRLPWCPRADGKRAAWGDQEPPIDLSAWSFGRLLEWRPETLAEEDARRSVSFDWSTHGPAASTVDGAVNELFVRPWAAEIAASSSRHEALLRKCRALGGLCAGHEISPGPYVRTLIEAAGDSHDTARTAEDGLSHGAQDPWTSTRLSRIEASVAAPSAVAQASTPEGQTAAVFEGPEPDVWDQLSLTKGSDEAPKRPKPTIRNVVLVLDCDSRWRGRVHTDLLRDQITLDGQVLTDGREVEIACWLEGVYGLETGPERVHQAVAAIAERHPINPVTDYLDGLVWDGKNRIDTWLVDLAGVEDSGDGLDAPYGRKFLISAVARAYDPGCQADSALVLQGEKGLRKTTTFRVLFGPDWHSESPLPIGSDEAPKKLAGIWGYELGELAALKRAAVEAVKQFVTTKVDRFRPSYGRNQVVKPRRCVFCGTTNEAAFLIEDDRRWWIRKVVRLADTGALERDRDQLWAEAVARYRGGEPWHLDDAESKLQSEDVDQYRHLDPWEAKVGDWISSRPVVTSAEVLEQCLSKPIGEVTRADEMRLGAILSRLGRTRVRISKGGRRTYQWKT